MALDRCGLDRRDGKEEKSAGKSEIQRIEQIKLWLRRAPLVVVKEEEEDDDEEDDEEDDEAAAEEKK